MVGVAYIGFEADALAFLYGVFIIGPADGQLSGKHGNELGGAFHVRLGIPIGALFYLHIVDGEFAMTALFVVIFIEQWLTAKNIIQTKEGAAI